ncbi:MAG: hypothetical protein ABI589_03725 [Burkholderiales bacterium]
MTIKPCRFATLAICGALALASCGERETPDASANDRFAEDEPLPARAWRVAQDAEDSGRFEPPPQGNPTMGQDRGFAKAGQAGQAGQTVMSRQAVMRPVRDSKTGLVAFNIPLPSDWQFPQRNTPQDPTIVGPDNIKVYQRHGGSYSWPTDPQMQQAYRAGGAAIRPPIAAEQLVQEDIAPLLQGAGLQLVRQYRLPQLAAVNEQYNSWLYKVAPSRTAFDVLATEWQAEDGTQVLVILNQSASSANGMVNWSYWLESLEAPKRRFSDASQALIHALSNKQHNPAQIQAYNAAEAGKLQQSQAQHNAKMQQKESHFQAMQRIHRDKVDSVNNSQMSIYRTQRDSFNRQQPEIVNGIREEQTVTNPHDGRQFQVEAGAAQYWMNSEGRYIKSDNSNFNPNLDPNLNQQEWRRAR